MKRNDGCGGGIEIHEGVNAKSKRVRLKYDWLVALVGRDDRLRGLARSRRVIIGDCAATRYEILADADHDEIMAILRDRYGIGDGDAVLMERWDAVVHGSDFIWTKEQGWDLA